MIKQLSISSPDSEEYDRMVNSCLGEGWRVVSRGYKNAGYGVRWWAILEKEVGDKYGT